jgi:hypothetical protein
MSKSIRLIVHVKLNSLLLHSIKQSIVPFLSDQSLNAIQLFPIYCEDFYE